jgi:DNA-binding transcriptional regulator GbsR (MarR family)
MRYELQMSKPSMSAGVKRLQEFDGVKQQFIRGAFLFENHRAIKITYAPIDTVKIHCFSNRVNYDIFRMSKPSMSAGVKRLQEFDGVKQQFIRGSRKQHFTAVLVLHLQNQ